MILNRRRRNLIAVAFTALFGLSAILNAVRVPFAHAGAPLYPDLQTAAPARLSIDRVKLTDGKVHYLLRFDNQIENHGGRLEIVADLSVSRDLYQNVFDAPTGGTLVEHQRIASDLIYHPTHNHFHVSDFADYSLYKKSASGVYRITTKRGSKTSFCILDSVKVLNTARNTPSYTDCNEKKQGLSAGWGDIYMSGLPDQWVDLGTRKLADGEYALHSTADPHNRIKETDDRNNTSVTLFVIKNGVIDRPAQEIPYCAAKPASAAVGRSLYISCERLPPDTGFSIRWRYESSDPITTATTNASGELVAEFVMPPSTRGAHYIYVSGGDPSTKLRVIVDTAPSITLATTSGKVGQSIGFAVAGFSAGSKVSITYEQTPGIWVSAGTATTDAKGSGAGSFVVPSSAMGPHQIRATESSDSPPATTELVVEPELRLQPDSGAPGAAARPWLRGFGGRDVVVLTLQETGATLGSVNVSNTGAANPNLTNEFVIPASLAPGVYHVVATGSKSGATATAVLTVTGIVEAAAPTSTSTSLPAAPTETPTPAGTPVFTATATATGDTMGSPPPSPETTSTPSSEPATTPVSTEPGVPSASETATV